MRMGYVDTRRDTVLVSLKTLDAMDNSLDLSRMEKLAFVEGWHSPGFESQQSWREYARAICPCLKTLTFVLGDTAPKLHDYDEHIPRLTEVNSDLRYLEVQRLPVEADSAFAGEDDIIPC